MNRNSFITVNRRHRSHDGVRPALNQSKITVTHFLLCFTAVLNQTQLLSPNNLNRKWSAEVSTWCCSCGSRRGLFWCKAARMTEMPPSVRRRSGVKGDEALPLCVYEHNKCPRKTCLVLFVFTVNYNAGILWSWREVKICSLISC